MSEQYDNPQSPHYTNTWSTGTVLASVTSIMSLLGVIGSIVWFSARVDTTVSIIPSISKQQEMNTQAIAIETTNQSYTDARYIEIQAQLANIEVQLQAIQAGKK